ncbi:root phototropism protein 3-like [Quillaja saponaria]|uniref:Root phototropism protein 3-like n=1 Tax=Quillaja saponaria TaxID=32244 RepID=A0AAD7KVV2_QUISA|nr:root phototropism protein 3-like [Quillaja saponaria]
MWESESESEAGLEYGNGAFTSSKQCVQTDGFEQRDQLWYVATDVPSDFLVQVENVYFHLHKYPLLSRSGDE